MDRSFLSDSKVIAASRDMVCVRLATYESAEEARFLKSIFVGRSGDLENTTFALLTPQGERVGRAGRSPDFVYRNAADLAEGMKKLAASYTARKGVARALPVVKNVRLALNVASCDGVPLVVVFDPEKTTHEALEKKVARVAWSPAVEGAFVYAVATDPRELAAIGSTTGGAGVVVVKPDTYGQRGEPIAVFAAKATEKELEAGLAKVRAGWKSVEKDPRSHIQEGRRRGVSWETEIPVTDPGPRGGGPPGGGPPGGGPR